MSAATYSFKGTADMSQHNKQVEGAKKEIKKYEDEVKNAQKEAGKLNDTDFSKAYSSQRQLQQVAKNTTKVLDGLGGNLKGTIGKIGMWGGAAVGAFALVKKVANDARKVSDEMADRYNAAMSGMSAATSRLSYDLARLDFSNLISNMRTAYHNAKELYDALDDLTTFNLINNETVSELDVQLEEARYNARMGVPGAKERVKELEDEIEKALNEATPRILEARDKAIKKALDWNRSKELKYDISSDEMWKKVLEKKVQDVSDLDYRLNRIDYELNSVTNGEYSNPAYWIGDSKIKAAVRELETERDAIKMAKKLTDDAIDEVNKNNEQLRANRTKVALMRRQDLRYLNNRDKGTGVPKGPSFEHDSIAEIDNEIKKIKDRLANEKFNINTQLKLTGDLKTLENKKAMLEMQVSFGSNEELKKIFGDQLDYVLHSGKVEDFCAGMVDMIERYLATVPELRLPEFVIPSDEMMASAKESMDNIDALIEQEWIKIMEEMKQSAEETSFILDSLASSIGSVGTAFVSVANSSDKTKAIISTLSSVASVIADTIGKLLALAAAKGVNSVFDIPWPANLGALASVLAAIASTTASIRSYADQKFAGGGIFKGNGPMIGDMHFARVNPGEMILNDRQQANLFRMLNNGTNIQGRSGEGHVTFRVSGTDLVGVLNNYDRQNRRVS